MTQRPPDHPKEMQTEVVWTCLPFIHQVRLKPSGKAQWKGGRRQSRQNKRWEDNIREWTGLEFAKSQEGSGEQGTMEETGCEVICGAPMTPAVKG